MNLPTRIKNYLGNPNLKRINMQLSLTEDQIREYIKCAKDPVYFIEHYVKIITLDKGFVQISLYPFQKQAVQDINDNRRVIVKAGRQVGKTTMVVGYILWYILFNEDKFVAILANKAPTAREILNRIKIAYESLPLWLQQGVRVWNKGDIELENNCRVMATSTASSAIRGYSISLLYLDEFAFVPSNIADEFFTSVYPTISSGTQSKILISSTPNGMNHYYRMWTEAVEGQNGFKYIEANWRQVPGRDQAWADDQRRILGEEKFLQEMECEFMGSAGTLLSAAALKSLAFVKPQHVSESGIKLYEAPIPEHSYVVIVDTSRGRGLDFSACIAIDITQIPYRLVATYKDNNISPLVYPSIIKQIADYYNQAQVLVEINDNGQQITEVEGQKIFIQDFDVISELSTFIAKGGSFEAEEGSHDDLVMCLVLFSWMTNQQFFADMTNTNIKQKLHEDQLRQIEEEALPTFLAGHVDVDNPDRRFVADGALWDVIER